MLIYVSDFSEKGTGYANIGLNLCNRLVERDWDVIVLGTSYKGTEHPYKYPIVPTEFFFVPQMIRNLIDQQKDNPVTALVTAMDIPLQVRLYKELGAAISIPWVTIFPVEGDPICFTWASGIAPFHERLVISKFGTEEVRKVNLSARYLPVGVDRNIWKPSGNRETMRKTMGIQDMFVVLTVADNQERKNLGMGLEIFAEFQKRVPNSLYFLVTKIDNPTGWYLKDFINELGLGGRVQLMQQGLPLDRLVGFYDVADAFLLPSKAEGLGMPVLEAMACGTPVVATDCTAIHENLEDGRGLLVTPELIMKDPWGNSRRYIISRQEAVDKLMFLYNMPEEVRQIMVQKGYDYVDTLDWGRTTDVLEASLLDAKLRTSIGELAPAGLIPSEVDQILAPSVEDNINEPAS